MQNDLADLRVSVDYYGQTKNLLVYVIYLWLPCIKFPGKIFILPENWGEPGRSAYNYFPQL